MYVLTSVDRNEMGIVNVFFDTLKEAQQAMAKQFSEDANISYEQALDIVMNGKEGNLDDEEYCEDDGWYEGCYSFSAREGSYESSVCGLINYQIDEVVVKKK